MVKPGVLRAANITALLHCALPNRSSYLIGLKKLEPKIFTGNLFAFDFISTPNNFNGSVILEKSLADKLLSPLIVTKLFELTNNPRINLASVPELPAFNSIFLFVLKLFNPKPAIS